MKSKFDLLKFDSTIAKIDEVTLQQFTGIFPDYLIDEWKERGIANYLNGLLQTTDPNDYYEIMKDWLEDSENCHVFLRTVFGTFFYMREDKFYYKGVLYNTSSDLGPNLNWIIKFALSNKDYQNDVLQKKTFDKIKKRLGSVDIDEMYAFFPALVVGGDFNTDNIKKVKLKEHLAYLAQLL